MFAHPKRIDIPILILGSLVLLIFGVQRPLMTIEKLLFWESKYSIISGIKNLLKNGNYFIGIVLLVFSVIFPFLKLFTLGFVWFGKIGSDVRKISLHWLEFLGKWSMLDVLIVAVIIFISRSGWMSKATPQIGLYLFSVAIFLSMIVTYMIKSVTSNYR